MYKPKTLTIHPILTPGSIPRFLVMLLVAAAITACSTTQMAYNNADWIATRFANDYLSLSSEQEDAWAPTLQRVLQRHRDEELSHIVGFLISLEVMVDAGLTQSRLECAAHRLEELYRRTARIAIAAASPLLVKLSDDQIRHLEGRLRERRIEFRRAYVEGSSSERLDNRAERVRQRIVRWTGDLTSAQNRLIKEAVMTWPDVAPDWDRYRTQKQRQFLALARSRPTGADMDQFLTRWWVDFSDRPPALRQKHELLKQGLIKLLVALDQSFSETQRTQLVENIRDLRTALQGLLDQPPDSSRIAYWDCRSVTRVSERSL